MLRPTVSVASFYMPCFQSKINYLKFDIDSHTIKHNNVNKTNSNFY